MADDLSNLSNEELMKLYNKEVSAPSKPDVAQLSDVELMEAYKKEVEGPSLMERGVSAVGGAIGKAAQFVDRFTGAPVRAGVYELTRTEPEFGKEKPSVMGNLKSAFSAAGGALAGEGAPSGRDIARDRLGINDEKRVSVPIYKFPNELTKTQIEDYKKRGVPFDGQRFLVGYEESMTPAEAAGLGVEAALDPTLAMSLGSAAIARGTGKAAKGFNRAMFGTKLKANADDIMDAAKTIGGKATPGQLIDSPAVKKLESLQAQSDLTIGSIGLRKTIEKNKKAAEDLAATFVENRSFKSAMETGSEFQQKFTKELSTKLEPAEQIYGAWEEAFKQTGLPVSKDRLVNKLNTLKTELKTNQEALKLIDTELKNIDSIETLYDLKNYRSQIGTELKDRMVGGNRRYVLSEIYGDATATRSDSLKKLAENPQYREFAQAAKEQIAEADKIYANSASAVENALLNKGKSGRFGPRRTAQNFFDTTTEAKRLDKVLKTADPKKLEKLAQDFPEAFEVLREGKIEDILSKVEVDGKIEPRRLVKALNKMPVESQNIIFGAGSKEKIKALKVFYESIPADVNPSKTALTEQLKGMINPVTQGFSAARGLMLRGITRPELGTDVFSRIGASELTAPLSTTGYVVGKGLSLPKERNEGLRLPREGR